MKILVLNSGSSSIKFQLFEMTSQTILCKGLVDRIGLSESSLKMTAGDTKKEIKDEIKNHHDALSLAIDLLLETLKLTNEAIDVVGHRVVHGGEFFNQPTIVNTDVLQKIKDISFLAPLHNPANIEVVETAIKLFPTAKQVAVFDTAFHQTMPEKAFRYAIPNSYYKKHNIRAFGFHGTSHLFVSKAAAEYLNKPIDTFNAISIHLGNGCSMAAIKNGKSIDTSMGFSPLAGLMMGTRSGDIDPSVLLYLQEKANLSIDEINKLLNKQSGLLGITGSSDLRDVLQRYDQGDEEAVLAVELYTYRIKKYIGSYLAVIGEELDAIIFTAGVGENSAVIREKSLDNLSFYGFSIDQNKNELRKKGVREIQSGKTKILIVPTDEELEIAKQAKELVD
jgi:acetate kinase